MPILTASQLRRDFKYLFPDELPLLQELVKALNLNPIIVNIGAGAGTSGLAILETRRDAILITIDVTDASSPFGCLEAERDVMQRAELADRYGKTWFQIHEDSKAVASRWEEVSHGPDYLKLYTDKIDLLFIDGDHSYEGCKGDILGFVPHVREYGIVAVHDYLKGDLKPNLDGPHPMPWPDVDRAVDEFLVPYYPIIDHVDSLIAFRKIDQ